MSKTAGFLVLVATAGFAAVPAAATTFTFPDFSSTSGLNLVGSATTATTSDGHVLRLIPSAGNQAGAAYSTSAVTLGSNATFSTAFSFRMTSPGGVDPADGITFVLAASPTGLGGSGNGMGYAGVGNSVAIEFDTYNNGNPGSLGFFSAEPNSSNHVAVDLNGALSNLDWANVGGNGSCGFSNGTPAQNSNTASTCMSNGELWNALITYDGSKLNVTVGSGANSYHVISDYALDIAGQIGGTSAYVGFTGSSGAGWENEDITHWTFADTATLPSTVPLPASLPLMLSGLAGAGLLRRRNTRRG